MMISSFDEFGKHLKQIAEIFIGFDEIRKQHTLYYIGKQYEIDISIHELFFCDDLNFVSNV